MWLGQANPIHIPLDWPAGHAKGCDSGWSVVLDHSNNGIHLYTSSTCGPEGYRIIRMSGDDTH